MMWNYTGFEAVSLFFLGYVVKDFLDHVFSGMDEITRDTFEDLNRGWWFWFWTKAILVAVFIFLTLHDGMN
jgi:hypothetical protein